MDLYDYIWTYDILLTDVIIHYWNKYVTIMHDIEYDTCILHVLYWQLHIEVNCVLLSTFTFVVHL